MRRRGSAVLIKGVCWAQFGRRSLVGIQPCCIIALHSEARVSKGVYGYVLVAKGLLTAEVSMVMVGALVRRTWVFGSESWWKGFESDMVVADVAPQECRTL
jgi:hypothetical protein